MAKKKPMIVWALGLYGLFGSLVTTFMGLVIVLDENRLNDFASLNLTNTGLLWFGGITLVLGLFGIYLASSILSGQKWARLWYSVVAALNIVAGFWQIIHHTGEMRWQGITIVVLWFITLQLLYKDKADEFFND